MQRRTANDIRPQEEQWLIDAITQDNTQGADMTIELIQSKMSTNSGLSFLPSLNSIDKNGDSFLFISISRNRELIAKRLFEIQKNDPAVLLHVNNKKQSHVYAAAFMRNVVLLKALVEAIKQCYETRESLRAMLTAADTSGDTPLHAAVSPIGSETTAYLIDNMRSIMSEENFIEQINKTNQTGDTPLHLAVQKKNKKLIALLVKSGADWEPVNHKGKSPFDYFCECDLDDKERIIERLYDRSDKKDKADEKYEKKGVKQQVNEYRYQQALLNLCQKKLSDASVSEYLHLASCVSLQDLIFAKAMTDIKIHAELTEDEAAHFLHGKTDLEVGKIEKNQQNDTIKKSLTVSGEKPLFDYQKRSADISRLGDLINSIDGYVADLENNPRYSEVKLRYAIVLPTLYWLVYASVETWFVYEKYAITAAIPCLEPHNDHCDEDPYPNRYDRNYSKLKTLLFGIAGAVAGIASIVVAIALWLKYPEREISQSEWRDLAANIREGVLDKLFDLSEEDVPLDHQTTVTALQTALASIKNNQPRQEVIDEFKQLSTILKNLRTKLSLGSYQHGITFFKPVEKSADAIVINIDGDDEATPLMLENDYAAIRYKRS